MKFLMEYLRQKAPKAGAEIPVYYRKSLYISGVLFSVYFFLSFLMFGIILQRWDSVPFIALAAILFCMAAVDRIGPNVNVGVYTVIMLGWCAWYVVLFGWSAGVQHFLIPLLLLSFFNVFEPPWFKLLFCLGLIGCRMAIYAYSQSHTPLYTLEPSARIALQTLNSVALYALLSCLCILFSTSILDTERQLRIDNQELHKEAGTDPLTLLPNRRAMLDEINRYLRRSPDEPFGVAIADIDFFKSINDTYGHNCGDYTLRTLSDKFREVAGEKYQVCRWGGEEFCFFLPGLNLDDAGAAMHDLCTAVKQMPLSFEGNDFSITITIGVSENDFHSPMEAILEEADRKLYLGKNSGRDQVVL